jgi:hypothetical protein
MRRTAAIAAALAAIMVFIPPAGAGQRQSRSACHTNATYRQAVRAGELPAIVAALHGGAPVAGVVLTSC